MLPLTTTASNVVAVALAATGAVLFGLASVRQHAAVRANAAPVLATRWERVAAAGRLVRQPAWFLGGVQAGLGGGLHVLALALAPITLVQPVGVLAVPVTVVVALRHHRRPVRTQLAGTFLSVAGVAALTLVLLVPATRPATLPPWPVVAVDAGTVLVVAAGAAAVLGWAPALLRCTGRAVLAATLFGLTSVLVRTLAAVVVSARPAPPGVVLTASVGIALALPLGVWAMQSAYLVGSPQVVICCLTVVDPLTAVVGGRVLLRDGATLTGATLVAAVGCALVAVAGIVLLTRDPPLEPAPRPQPAALSGTRPGLT